MANVLQWIGLAFGTGVIALGVYGFVRGPSLPANEAGASRARQGRQLADLIHPTPQGSADELHEIWR